MRTSTAHQFLMKELRMGPGIFLIKTSGIGVCRGELSRRPSDFRLLPSCFLTPPHISGLFRTNPSQTVPRLVHLLSTYSNSNRPSMN
jgi:hypothetical protein